MKKQMPDKMLFALLSLCISAGFVWGVYYNQTFVPPKIQKEYVTEYINTPCNYSCNMNMFDNQQQADEFAKNLRRHNETATYGIMRFNWVLTEDEMLKFKIAIEKFHTLKQGEIYELSLIHI